MFNKFGRISQELSQNNYNKMNKNTERGETNKKEEFVWTVEVEEGTYCSINDEIGSKRRG